MIWEKVEKLIIAGKEIELRGARETGFVVLIVSYVFIGFVIAEMLFVFY